MKPITFEAPEPMIEWLNAEARRRGTSRGEILRHAVYGLQATGHAASQVPANGLPMACQVPANGQWPAGGADASRARADKSYSLDRGDGLPEEKEKQESPPTVSTAPEPPEPPEEAGDLDPLEFWRPKEPPAPPPPAVPAALAADQPVLPELAGALPPPPETPAAARPRRKRSKPAEDPDADPMARHPEGVRRVFAVWKRALELIGETPPKVIAKEDAIVINSRLAEGIPVKNLQQAVDGWTLDPWPERRSPTAHLIRQLLKNRETVEKFRKFQLDFEAQDAREYEDQKRYWDLLEKAGIAEAMREKNRQFLAAPLGQEATAK